MSDSKKGNKRYSAIYFKREIRRDSKSRGNKLRGSKPKISKPRLSVPKICVDEIQLVEEAYNDNNFWNIKKKDSNYIKKLGEEALKDLD